MPPLLHPGEVPLTARMARRLIAGQMPDLAGLPLRKVGAAGTDNVLFRLGSDRVGRFPRLPHAAAQIGREAHFLPGLAPALPLAVPLAERFGRPDGSYPFPWSVGRWLPGSDALAAPFDQAEAARVLAGLLRSLQAQPAPDDPARLGPPVELAPRLRALERYIGEFTPEEGDRVAMLRLLNWSRGLAPFMGPKVWLHGDLHPLNLLVRRGRLSAVIDWGALGYGDPAADLIAGWTLFDPPARARFRELLQPDPGAWNRGRALAFAKSVMAVPYYRRSNPRLRDVMKATLARILAEG